MSTFCYELYQKHQASFDARGLLEAKRYFLVDHDGADGVMPTEGYLIPEIGDSFNASYPLLICKSYTIAADEASLGWEVICNYTTEGLTTESFMNTNMSFTAEALDTTTYTRWASAGTIVDVPISTVYPSAEYIVTFKREFTEGYTPVMDRTAIMGCVGKLNDRKFHGFPAETLLFEGAEHNQELNQVGVVIKASVTYKFLYRVRSHNEVYRAARQQMDADNNPAYYNDVPGSIFQASGTHKVGDPVMVSDPIAGVGGWDKPYWMEGSTVKYRYDLANFGSVLGIPIYAGDAAI